VTHFSQTRLPSDCFAIPVTFRAPSAREKLTRANDHRNGEVVVEKSLEMHRFEQATLDPQANSSDVLVDQSQGY
jgi:hypothetical protein